MTTPKGLTYIELMIAIALLTAISLAVGNFASSGLRLWRLTREQVQLQEQVRKSLQGVVKEIRELETSENGSFAIESAQENAFIFYANVDSDNQRERIRYFWENNELRRGLIEPTGSPATYPLQNETVTTAAKNVYVSGPMFTYYDGSYTGSEPSLTLPVNPQDVHLIEIHFLIDADPSTAPVPADMITQVTPRNLKQYAPSP